MGACRAAAAQLVCRARALTFRYPQGGGREIPLASRIILVCGHMTDDVGPPVARAEAWAAVRELRPARARVRPHCVVRLIGVLRVARVDGVRDAARQASAEGA
jgi:hypothetical protein